MRSLSVRAWVTILIVVAGAFIWGYWLFAPRSAPSPEAEYKAKKETKLKAEYWFDDDTGLCFATLSRWRGGWYMESSTNVPCSPRVMMYAKKK